MTTAILIWLYFSISKLVGTTVGFLGGATIIWAIGVVRCTVEEEMETCKSFMKSKWIPISFLVVLSISAFLPSKESLKYIIGGTALWHISQMEEAKKLPDNVLGAANAILEEIKKEGE